MPDHARLWRAAGACELGQEEKHGRKRHWPADARSRVIWWQPAGAARSLPHGGTRSQTGARLGRPLFHCFPAEPALGCRHHLRADGERFSLSRSGSGCLEPQDCRLVDGHHLRTELVLDALEMRSASAAGRRHPSQRPGQPIHIVGVRQNVAGRLASAVNGSVGDAYDNAMCESFFATLECELLERRRFTSKIEAKMACFSFIEGWYNPVRLHSALGYRSPMAYEAAMEAVTTEP